MWEELSNSKMFWLIAAVTGGLVLGVIFRKVTRSKYSLGAISMPFIGLLLILLFLKFVKLNVAYYDVKYTLIGVGGILILALIMGFIGWKTNPDKAPFWVNMTFFFTALSIVVFYIFYKDELPINTTQAGEAKNIYLLLKKEDAGYYEINENGIGYTGVTGYVNGFRPRFLNAGIDENKYDHTPVAIDISTKDGIAHALLFKSIQGEAFALNLDSLINAGTVKSAELLMGELPK